MGCPRRLVTVLAVLVLACGASSSAGARSPQGVSLHYRGVTVIVPSGWPVYDLARAPATCVRFDRHAVYLGTPGVSERCPAHLAGRTEALLLEPIGARAAASGAFASGAPTGGQATRAVLAGGRILAVATWHRAPALLTRALSLRQLPAAPRYPSASAAAPPRASAAAPPRASAAARYTAGLGFDACATPSARTMKAWRASPYHSVGVYVGGSNMACAQPNLTSSWVSTETAAGWHLIPTYVGLQAPTTSCSCATIIPSRAAAQGKAAATDAITNAAAIGIGRGNPILYDMEAYDTTSSATRTVLAFLSAWTSTLHSAGYLSGVYSSSASGISDLVAAQRSSFVEPDEVWFAHWNGAHTATDSYIPPGDWPNHSRIHQYAGGVDVTYGGYTLNVDGDYLDGPAAPVGGPTIADGTFITVTGGNGVIYRVAGGAPLPVNSLLAFGSPRSLTRVTQTQFNTLNRTPADGTFLVTTTGRIFRVAGGAPLPVSGWSLFGGMKNSVTIDEWDIDNISSAISHLNSVPAPGTVVEGLPSGRLWQFVGGGRTALAGSGPAGSGTASSGEVGSGGVGSGATGSGPSATSVPASAIAVDDAALTRFPVVKVVPGCTVPRLYRLTLSAATQALTRAHCRVGRVSRPMHVAPGHALRVSGQSPPPGHRHSSGYRVTLTMR